MCLTAMTVGGGPATRNHSQAFEKCGMPSVRAFFRPIARPIILITSMYPAITVHIESYLVSALAPYVAL